MKIVSWNMNHRSRQVPVPGWVVDELLAPEADVLALTEYVPGPNHADVIARLDAAGFDNRTLTEAAGGKNQLLLASRRPIETVAIPDPRIHPQILPNVCMARVEDALDIVAFRMPAFSGPELALKRTTWDWLIDTVQPRVAGAALLFGDFNTAIGTSRRLCGDRIDALLERGWRHLVAEGYSYRTVAGRETTIDHAFASPSCPRADLRFSWSFALSAGGKTSPGHPDHALMEITVD